MDKCTICLEKVNGIGGTPGCGHNFHIHCLRDWKDTPRTIEIRDNDFNTVSHHPLNTRNKCPVCQIRYNEILMVRNPGTLYAEMIGRIGAGQDEQQPELQDDDDETDDEIIFVEEVVNNRTSGSRQGTSAARRNSGPAVSARINASTQQSEMDVTVGDAIEEPAIQQEMRNGAPLADDVDVRDPSQVAINPQPQLELIEDNDDVIDPIGVAWQTEGAEGTGLQHDIVATAGTWMPPPGCLVCDICGRTFNSTAALSHHRPLHDGVEFKCQVCNKTFKYRNNLAVHQRKKQHRPEDVAAIQQEHRRNRRRQRNRQ